MANSVNDVMNVIASPDYGIKNIAGTNQEIVAILSGNHNSKNNIHNLVDDIRNILQKLVDTQTKKKSIEIGSDSIKINNKHIHNILDEAKGIRKSIDNLAKIIQNRDGKNMPAIAKLSAKSSQKVADAMIKNIDKENKKGGMSIIIDAFTKLKNISLKDIVIGKQKIKQITKIFDESKKKLNIEEKDLDTIIKLINNTPIMFKSLTKNGWRIDYVIKHNIIKKLNNILVGKNSLLTIANILQKNQKSFENSRKIAKDIKELTSSLNKAMLQLVLSSMIGKLANNGIKYIDSVIENLIPFVKKLTKIKDIEKETKTAKQITILVGNLLITSIFLTIAAVTGVPALLGAKLLNKIIDSIIPVVVKLSKNNKQMSKAVNASISLVACTGLMAISSIFLASIAVTGVPALLGSLLLVGIVKLNVYIFNILSKTQKNITKGAISMIIMSTSLLIYGIALKKIIDSTKGVTLKQIGIIASVTVILSGAIVALGIPAIFPFIALGSIAMGIMGISLISFGKSLDIISKATKNLKMKQILIVAGAMGTLGVTIAGLSFLSIPIGLGAITLGVMVTSLYTFIKTIKTINDMKEIPSKKVYQILNTMKAIGIFFKNNSIKLKTILTAKKYKSILRPFAETIKYLSNLKDLGFIPIKLVYGALNAMRTISNYYIENPIKKKAIKAAEKYKKILKPFGKTIGYLSKLKDLGFIPIKLVYGALNAMRTISNYYIENPIKKKAIKAAEKYKKIIKPFGKTIGYLSKIKEIGHVSTNNIKNILEIIDYISKFYKNIKISDDIELKSEFVKKTIEKFNDMSMGMYLKNSQDFTKRNYDNVKLVIKSMKKIINFLKYNTLNTIQSKRARKNISLLNLMSSTMSDMSNINMSNISSIGVSLTNALSGINTIDISQVKAVTNMFDTFNKINKSENIINKFTESVKEFTTTCKNLMDAMSQNTDAINNIDTSSMGNSFINVVDKHNYFDNNSNNTTQTNDIRISNVDEIAKKIADKINGALSIDVPETQIQLLINGMGGNEWTITRYY